MFEYNLKFIVIVALAFKQDENLKRPLTHAVIFILLFIFGSLVLIYSICKGKFKKSQSEANSVLFGLYSEFQSKTIALANWGLLLVF